MRKAIASMRQPAGPFVRVPDATTESRRHNRGKGSELVFYLLDQSSLKAEEEAEGVVQEGAQAAARLVGYLGNSDRRYEFFDASLHGPIHLGDNARYAVLFNYFDVVNGITPDRIAGFEIRNLG